MAEIIRSKKPLRFRIPDEIIPTLRDRKKRQGAWRDLINQEDVVLLYHGLGPAVFLTMDGRVIVDRSVDYPVADAYEVEEASPEIAWGCIRLAAKQFDCRELRRLFPQDPPGSFPCPTCQGYGLLKLPFKNKPDGEFLCGCH